MLRFLQGAVGVHIRLGRCRRRCFVRFELLFCVRKVLLGLFRLFFQFLKALFRKRHQILCFLNLGFSGLQISLRITDLFLRRSDLFIRGFCRVLCIRRSLICRVLQRLCIGKRARLFVRSILRRRRSLVLSGLFSLLCLQLVRCLICGSLGRRGRSFQTRSFRVKSVGCFLERIRFLLRVLSGLFGFLLVDARRLCRFRQPVSLRLRVGVVSLCAVRFASGGGGGVLRGGLLRGSLFGGGLCFRGSGFGFCLVRVGRVQRFVGGILFRLRLFRFRLRLFRFRLRIFRFRLRLFRFRLRLIQRFLRVGKGAVRLIPIFIRGSFFCLRLIQRALGLRLGGLRLGGLRVGIARPVRPATL